MKHKKFIFGNLAGILAASAILVTVNVLALSTFKDDISIYLGGSGVQGATDDSDAFTNAAEVVDRVMDEGMVLLKNENNALPLGADNLSEKVKVNVFGFNTINMFYGGSGSGASNVEDPETYLKSYKDAGIEYNQDIIDLLEANANSVDKDIGNPLGGSFYPAIPELSVDLYREHIEEYKNYSNVAIINIGRTGGEGLDIPSGHPGEYKDQSGKGTEVDYLDLSKNETDLIKLCAENFEKVIVCLNIANTVELNELDQEGVDAVLWIGHPGSYGLSEVGKILRGQVNPSGRITDTFVYDNESSPASRNAGAYYTQTYSNNKSLYYVDYEEGIYVGYKYYETRYLNDEAGYDAVVQYPFGSGLSYTEFEQKIVNSSLGGTDGQISVTVNVKNNGQYPGKEVVQLYYTAPYTNGGIEKSAVNLVQFEKTDVIAPGEDVDITLTFDVQEMASYDYDDANNNNHKGYELEAGDYEIKLQNNSHDIIGTPIKYHVDSTVYYDESSTGYTIKNQFDNANGIEEEGVTYLTRADNFTANFPSLEKPQARATSKLVQDELALKPEVNPNDKDIVTNTITHEVDAEKRDENGDIVYDDDGNIVYETTIDDDGNETIKKRGLYLSDMAGLDYDDPLWEDLLNQLTLEEIGDLIAYGGYQTSAVPSINKGINRDLDGPQGFNFSNVSYENLKAMSYPSEIVSAATWNKELIKEEGDAFAREAQEMGVTGLYAPAMNIHRSPYAGRNFEYYSEDPILSGYMGANFTKGAVDKGLNVFIKHFAVNDQETQRYGLFTWIDEQALREIYLKPFQMSVEEGGARAVMSAFNRIGATWAGCNYSLLTEVLRNEWGFKGMVLTDYYMVFQTFMDVDRGIRAGNDCFLAGLPALGKLPDLSNNTAKQAARKCAHNILYSVANARATNVSLNDSWLNWFIPLDVILFVLLLAWGGFVSYKAFKFNRKETVEITEAETDKK